MRNECNQLRDWNRRVAFLLFFLPPAHVVIRDTPSVRLRLFVMAAAIFDFDQKPLVGQRMALETSTFQGQQGIATASDLNSLRLNTHTHFAVWDAKDHMKVKTSRDKCCQNIVNDLFFNNFF